MDLYRNNLKNRDFGKEAPQNFNSERTTIAERQGVSENQNSEAKPTQPKTDSSGCFDIEEKIKIYMELGRKIEELEQQKKLLNLDILQQIPEKSVQVADSIVRKCKRLIIKTSLEEARLFEATKMTETVDKEKIKDLHQLGQSIPGISEIQYIQISPRKFSLSHQLEKA